MNKQNSQIKVEMMKYRRNKLPYGLVLLGLAFNVFYFISLYTNNGEFFYTLRIGASVIYNLLFMLFVFLSAENIKVYNRKFSYVVLGIGLMQIVRIFAYPRDAFLAEAISLSAYTLNVVFLAVSAVCLISGAIISFIRSTSLINYIKKEEELKLQTTEGE